MRERDKRNKARMGLGLIGGLVAWAIRPAGRNFMIADSETSLDTPNLRWYME
jgi:hypothetical protein